MNYMKLLKLKNKQLFCIALILFQINKSHAQFNLFTKKEKLNQYSSVGFGGGTSNYFGDLSPYRYFYYGLISSVRWNATINYTRQLNPQLAARVSFTWARIAGDDYNYSQRNIVKFQNAFLRNLHFRNDIKEFTISALYNIIPNGSGQRGRIRLNPYIFGGFGFYAHNPQARDVVNTSVDFNTRIFTVTSLGAWTNLKDKQTAGSNVDYSLVKPVFPIGFGFKYRINKSFDLGVEGGLRITPFDYLDDVGKDPYIDPLILAANGNPKSAVFANRVNDNFAASTGGSRVEQFAQIARDTYFYSGNPRPSVDGERIWGFNTGSVRGTGKWDSYLLGQISLHYIINAQAKCPPIK